MQARGTRRVTMVIFGRRLAQRIAMALQIGAEKSYVDNQFGGTIFEVNHQRELCLPAVLDPP